MVGPCCGQMRLQKACIITGAAETVMSAIFLLYNGIILASEAPLAWEEYKNAREVEDPYRFHAIRVVLSGLNASYWVGCLFLGLWLTLGAKQRDSRKLRSWFVLTCILTVVFSVDIFMEVFSMLAPVIAIISPIVGTIIQCYMLWIVWEFMDEVAQGGCKAITAKKVYAKSMEEDSY